MTHPALDTMYDPTTIVPSGVRLTVEDVLASLEKAVQQKGADWVDPGASNSGCRYSVYENEEPVAPSCIVGNVLWQHGVVVARKDEAGSVGSLARRMESRGFVIEEKAVRVLQTAQSTQDNGFAWGLALQDARETAAQA